MLNFLEENIFICSILMIMLLNMAYILFACKWTSFTKKYIALNIFYIFLLNETIFDKLLPTLSKNSLLELFLKEFDNINNFNYFINPNNFIISFSGITAITAGLLIFVASIKEKDKKYLLFETTKIGEIVISIIFVYGMFIIDVRTYFIYAPIILITTQILKAINLIVIVEKNKSNYTKIFSDTIDKHLKPYKNFEEKSFTDFIIRSDIFKFYEEKDNLDNYIPIVAKKSGYIDSINYKLLNKIVNINNKIKVRKAQEKILILNRKYLNNYINKKDELFWINNDYKKAFRKINFNKLYILKKKVRKNTKLKDFILILEDSLIEAIRAKNLTKVRESIVIFGEFIEKTELSIFNTTNIWIVKNTISDFVFEVYSLAFSAEDDEIFKEICPLATRVAKRAFESDNFEAFYYSIINLPKMYEYYLKSKHTYFDYRVYFEFDDLIKYVINDSKSNDVRKYLFEIHYNIQELLITTIRKEDKETFKEFLKLVSYEINNKEKDEVFRIQKTVYIGVVYYLINNKNTININPFLKIIFDKLELNFNELLDLFQYVDKTGVSSILRWNDWFIPNKGFSVIRISTINPKFNLYFIKTLLLISVCKNGLNIPDNIKIENNYDVYLENTEKIKQELNNWKEIFSINNEKIEIFLILIKEKKEKEDKKREEEVKKSPISLDKLEKFKNNLSENLKKSKILNFFKSKNKYNYIEEGPDNKIKTFGISQVLSKEIFVKSDNSYISSIESEIFQSIEISSENYIIDELDNLSVKGKKSLCEILKNFNNNENLIVFSSSIYIENLMEKYDKIFIPHWSLEDNIKSKFNFYDMFLGVLKEKNFIIPVYHFYNSKKCIFLFNFDKINNFNHYNPVSLNKKEKVEYCSFYLEAFSDNSEIKNEVLKMNPQWLEKFDDEKLKKEELDKYVWLKVHQKIKLNFNDEIKSSVYKLE